jgi:hypothetical protein
VILSLERHELINCKIVLEESDRGGDKRFRGPPFKE